MADYRSRLPSLFDDMQPARWGTDPFTALRREMDRLLNDAVRGLGWPATVGGASFGVPSIDVSETQDEFRVCAELPGIDQKDIDVTLDGDLLTIRGEKRAESRDESENRHLTERSYGTFSRTIRLPFPTDPDQVTAHCQNGVLTVTMPKPAETRQRQRRITVTSGAAPTTAGTQSVGKLGDAARAMRDVENPPAAGSSGVGQSAVEAEARAPEHPHAAPPPH